MNLCNPNPRCCRAAFLRGTSASARCRGAAAALRLPIDDGGDPRPCGSPQSARRPHSGAGRRRPGRCCCAHRQSGGGAGQRDRFRRVRLQRRAGRRRKGLGRLPVRAGMAWSRNRGMRRAWVYFLADNHVMARLARRAGMDIVLRGGRVRGGDDAAASDAIQLHPRVGSGAVGDLGRAGPAPTATCSGGPPGMLNGRKAGPGAAESAGFRRAGRLIRTCNRPRGTAN